MRAQRDRSASRSIQPTGGTLGNNRCHNLLCWWTTTRCPCSGKSFVCSIYHFEGAIRYGSIAKWTSDCHSIGILPIAGLVTTGLFSAIAVATTPPCVLGEDDRVYVRVDCPFGAGPVRASNVGGSRSCRPGSRDLRDYSFRFSHENTALFSSAYPSAVQASLWTPAGGESCHLCCCCARLGYNVDAPANRFVEVLPAHYAVLFEKRVQDIESIFPIRWLDVRSLAKRELRCVKN